MHLGDNWQLTLGIGIVLGFWYFKVQEWLETKNTYSITAKTYLELKKNVLDEFHVEVSMLSYQKYHILILLQYETKIVFYFLKIITTWIMSPEFIA